MGTDWTVERAAKVCPVFRSLTGNAPEPVTRAARWQSKEGHGVWRKARKVRHLCFGGLDMSRQPEPHTAAAAHRALYEATTALLADLNTATENATDPLAMAGTYCGIIAQHIMPLRAALADVEFYEQAERVMDALFRDRADAGGR